MYYIIRMAIDKQPTVGKRAKKVEKPLDCIAGTHLGCNKNKFK